MARTSHASSSGRKTFPALAILTLIVLTTTQTIAHASAQSGSGYDLTWNTIEDGGYMFSTGGAIGQFDIGTMSGGSCTMTGGVWVDFGGSSLYLPLTIR